MMRRLMYIFACLLIVMPSLIMAADDDGGTESIFNLGAGARAMGMGNAFTAWASDATAIYYNPAGLSLLPAQQVTFLHTTLFESTIYDYLAYVYPHLDFGGLGVGVMRIGTDDIGRRDYLTDVGGDDLASFTASQMQLMLAYGRSFGRHIQAGVGFKVLNQSVDNLSAYGYGIDLGAQVMILRNLRAGVFLQDIVGPRLTLVDARERTPFTLKSGMAYSFDLKDSPISGTIALDVDKPENRSAKIRGGLELRHEAGIAIRGGYDRDNIALGVGLEYDRVRFDYAIKFVDYLTDSHRFSLSFDFGRTQEEIRAGREAQREAVDEQMIEERRERQLRAALEDADRYYEKGQLDSALATYYRAEAFTEDVEAIEARIAEIRRRMAETGTGLEPIIIVDSVLVQQGQNYEQQAQQLYKAGALAAARDMVLIARQYQGATASLDSLEARIETAITRRIEENLQKADNAMFLKDFVTAYDSYNTVLRLDSDNRLADRGAKQAAKRLNLAQHLNLALDYFNQEKYISAQREFNRVLEFDPENQTAQEYLRRIDEQLRTSTTLEDLQKDDRIWRQYLSGLEAFRLGQYETAIQYWEEVLEAYPNNQNTIENIEQARLRLQRKQ